MLLELGVEQCELVPKRVLPRRCAERGLVVLDRAVVVVRRDERLADASRKKRILRIERERRLERANCSVRLLNAHVCLPEENVRLLCRGAIDELLVACNVLALVPALLEEDCRFNELRLDVRRRIGAHSLQVPHRLVDLYSFVGELELEWVRMYICTRVSGSVIIRQLSERRQFDNAPARA